MARSLRLSGFLAISLGSLLAMLAFGQSFARVAVDANRGERWREDVRYLARTLPKAHKDLFFSLGREEFDSRMAQLETRVDALTDPEIFLELATIVASVNDSHTTVVPNLKFSGVPAKFQWFADGIFPITWGVKYRDIAHGRLVGIGERSIEEVIRELSRALPHENLAGVKAKIPNLLNNYDVLAAAGLIPKTRVIRYWVEDEDGVKRAVDLTVGSLAGPYEQAFAGQGDEAPLYLRRDDWFWHELIAGRRAIYVQYNRCWDRSVQKRADPKTPDLAEYPDFHEFRERVFAALDANPVEVIIVDLRNNGGGSSQLGTGFVKALAAHPKVRGGVRIVGIIGRRTFSSALINALDLKRVVQARLYGEPTSGKPNHYGEVKYLELPNSKWKVSYSTKFFRYLKDDPESLHPDVAVEAAYSDYVSGWDPVLARILADHGLPLAQAAGLETP